MAAWGHWCAAGGGLFAGELPMGPGLVVKAVSSGSRSQTDVGVEVRGWGVGEGPGRDPHQADADRMRPVNNMIVLVCDPKW